MEVLAGVMFVAVVVLCGAMVVVIRQIAVEMVRLVRDVNIVEPPAIPTGELSPTVPTEQFHPDVEMDEWINQHGMPMRAGWGPTMAVPGELPHEMDDDSSDQ